MTGPTDKPEDQFPSEDDRLAARDRIMQLRQQLAAEGKPFGWYEALYAGADRNIRSIPWAGAAPVQLLTPVLAEIMQAQKQRGRHRPKAVDVACGIGDNAQFLADAGFDVTGFDLSQSAIDWAIERFGTDKVNYRQADLMQLPDGFERQFDLVHECYTLQSNPPEFLPQIAGQIAKLVAPGGSLLVLTRGREPGEEADGPPTPLTKDQVMQFEGFGLTPVSFTSHYDEETMPIRHFVARFVREG